MHKKKQKTKVFNKYLVWQSIDAQDYISHTVTTHDPNILTQKSTWTNVWKKSLLPFILKYHLRSSVLFWAKLATFIYITRGTDCLICRNIDFAHKKNGPPNLLQRDSLSNFGQYATKYSLKSTMYDRKLHVFLHVFIENAKLKRVLEKLYM